MAIQEQARETTSAMTFNIRGAGRERDGVNHWSRRKGLNVRVIKEASADTVGFQEAQYGNLATYAEKLRADYHHILGLNMDDGNFNPIFWKKGRHELIDHDGIWLHPDQIPNAVATEWDAGNIRSATWAVFTDNTTGKNVARINTHLDHISERARYEGARLILRKWQEIGEDMPTIVTGDFNSGRYIPDGLTVNYTDAALKVFEDAEFIDLYAQFHTDGPGSNTFHNFEGEAYNPAHSYGLWRVDYILARGFEPVSCDIVKDARPPLYPSDHYPVISEVK